jgi:hypothetical protein
MTNKRKRVSKHKDISRIDQESKRTHGWYVRVSFQGKEHSKFFSDKKNGGKESALLAAITWRNNTRDCKGSNLLLTLVKQVQTDFRFVKKIRI